MHTRYQPSARIGGRYLVHDALMGGMGEVYLCLDLETIEPYALKTFQARYLANPKVRALFKQEVGTWVALGKHPNIVRCFYMESLDNQPFMQLEWVVGASRGRDLRSWLRRGPLDLRLALDFTIDICRGLIHAHQSHIVHRDLKPGNILLAQGRVAKITDFGLATVVQEAELEIGGVESTVNGRQKLLATDGVVGTPPYMAPEQWRAEAVDARTDIYAVGCILYELLSGQLAYRASTLSGFRRQHENAPLPTLSESIPLSTQLNRLLARCLAKRPEERWASAEALLSALSALYQQHIGQMPRAMAAIGQLTATDYNNRGLTYHKLQRYDEALSDYAHAIQLDRSYAQAYNNRALSYAKLQRHHEALADYARAIQLAPTDAHPYANRGLTYEALQRYNEAIADYSQAIQLDPHDTLAYINRGNTYETLQRYDKALRDYNRAIQLDATFAQAYYNRAFTYDTLGYDHEAIADYTRAIQLDPSDLSSYINRGIIYDTLQRYHEAVADYNRAIQLNPTYANTYYNRGRTYEKLQRLDSALADYKQAIHLNPTYAAAYFNLGALLGDQGALREALPYFEKAGQLGEPLGAQYAAQVKQMLGIANVVKAHPPAFEAFVKANSPDKMQQAIVQFPFMTNQDFIAAIAQAISQQIPTEQQPAFRLRLAWLRQIANQQK